MVKLAKRIKMFNNESFEDHLTTKRKREKGEVKCKILSYCRFGFFFSLEFPKDSHLFHFG